MDSIFDVDTGLVSATASAFGLRFADDFLEVFFGLLINWIYLPILKAIALQVKSDKFDINSSFKNLSNLGQPPWERRRPRRLLWALRAAEDIGVPRGL